MPTILSKRGGWRGARPTHIESDTFPRLEKKGFRSAGSCSLKQFRHVVFFVFACFRTAYVYVYSMYMYICMSEKFGICIYIKLTLLSLVARVVRGLRS